MRSRTAVLCALAVTCSTALGSFAATAEAQPQSTLALRIVDSHGAPVRGAMARVANRSAAVASDKQGLARLQIAMPAKRNALVTLRISGPQGGKLVEHQVPLGAGVTRRYRLQMPAGTVKRYFAGVPHSRIAALQAAASRRAKRALRAGAHASAVPGMCSGWGSLTQPPSSIKVARRTNNSPSGSIYRIDTVDYKTYTRRVLPQEWLIGWPAESLKAGSLAVKAYAWNRAVTQGGRSWNGQCYDVDDTVNYQVYRDSTASSTDAAVNSAWNTWVRKNNQTFWAGYTAGPAGAACGAGNENGTHMWQWGTKTCADQGKGYKDIVDDYYFPVSFFTLDVAPFGNELAFVARQYTDFYGRPIPAPDAAWLIAALWNGTTATGEIDSILRSGEADRGIQGVVRLYYAAFDRHPDAGARTWLNKPLTSVASGLIASTEGRQKLPTDPAAFVRKVYTNALNRTASSSEVSYWVNRVKSQGRPAVLVGISESAEHRGIRRGLAPVEALYLAMLHRPADTGARDYWVPIIAKTPAASAFLVETIRRSAEYNRLIN
jgi:hypothetical protein